MDLALSSLLGPALQSVLTLKRDFVLNSAGVDSELKSAPDLKTSRSEMFSFNEASHLDTSGSF